MAIVLCILAGLACISGINAADPPVFDHGVDLETTRPLILAHRGFCGAYPDHTVKAYEEAIRLGADVIECDVVVTKDLKLICLHEPYLKGTTDVEEKSEFASRKTTYTIGTNQVSDDWFSVDFTLEELKTLRMKQRLSYRDPSFNGDDDMQIVTLEEYIQIAQASTKKIGIYPETKSPSWFNSLDIFQNTSKTFEDLLLDVLTSYGYTEPTDPCFVQSFEESSLTYMSSRTDLPLIMLISGSRSGDDITNEELTRWAGFCYGIGPSKGSIVSTSSSRIIAVTYLVDRAHAVGLKVHPYTFRNEDRYLAWDYMQDPWFEYDKFFELGIDGYFTDFTPTLVRFIEEKYRVCPDPGTGNANTLTQSFLVILISALILMIF